MNTQATNNVDALLSLKPGMKVKIETRKYKSRVVEGTAAAEQVGTTWYVYLTSGRVQPGNMAGGSLSYRDSGEIWFQPTMLQQVDQVSKLTVV